MRFVVTKLLEVGMFAGAVLAYVEAGLAALATVGVATVVIALVVAAL